MYYRCLACGRLAALPDFGKLDRCPWPACGSMNGEVIDAEAARRLLAARTSPTPKSNKGDSEAHR